MSSIIPQPATSGTFDAERFARAAVQDSLLTDYLIDYLERRVIALEEAIATGHLADLGAQLRASTERFAWAGDTFYARRVEDAANAWLALRPGGDR